MSERKLSLELRPEISCESCPPSACCKGPTWIDLTVEEAALMIKGGNRLIALDTPKPHDREVMTPIVMSKKTDITYGIPDVVPAGKGRYVMPDDCAYLASNEDGQNYCSIYEQRPFACQKYEMGGEGCKTARQINGVDPVEKGGPADLHMQLRAQLEANL